MNFPNQLTNPPQPNWAVRVNEAFKSLRGRALYAPNDLTTTGRILGYFGGNLGDTVIADGTVGPLAASATSYVVAHRTTGVVTHATDTTNWNDTTTYGRLFKVVTDASSITSAIDWALQEGGILRGGSSGGGGEGNVIASHAQAAQSGNYIDRRGMWSDPLLVGTGALTVGSISTITDDAKYNAWPTTPARLRDGQVLLAYTKGDSHHGDLTGKAVGKLGTEGLNGVITFGSEFTIYDDPSKWVSVYGVKQIDSGRIFASLWTDSGSGSTDGRALITYTDDGTSWVTPISLHAASGFTLASYCGGEVVQLPDGSLLVPVEGFDSGETYLNSDVRVLRSTDGGLTWALWATVATQSGDGRPYYEPKLALLDDGSLLIAMRTTGGSPGTIYLSRCTDLAGAVWGARYAGPAGYGAPSFIQRATGTLLMVTRQNATGAVIAFTSTDRGATFGAGTVLDNTMFEMEYGAPFDLLDGRVLVFYGYQPTSSVTNSDIKQVYVTEAVTDLRGVVLDLHGTGLDADAAGFRGIPQNSQTGNYTTVAADAGKHLIHPAGAGAGDTFTIAANASVAYEVGTAITFVNMATDALTIAINSDTLNLAGAGTTGSRTLAQYGIATAVKVTSTGWLINGTGLT